MKAIICILVLVALSFFGYKYFFDPPACDLATADQLLGEKRLGSVNVSSSEGRKSENKSITITSSSMEYIENCCSIITTAVSNKLSETCRMIDFGEELVFRTKEGMIRKARFSGVNGNFALIQEGAKLEEVPFKDIDIESRLKVDREFRRAWISIEAVTLSRLYLTEENRVLPGDNFGALDIAPSIHDIGILESSPNALLAAANSYLKGSVSTRDYGYGYLLLRSAAFQNSPEGQYLFGRLCLLSKVTECSREEAMAWIVRSAKGDYDAASKYLVKHRVNPGTVQKELDKCRILITEKLQFCKTLLADIPSPDKT